MKNIILVVVCSALVILSAITFSAKSERPGRLYGSAMREKLHEVAEQTVPGPNKGPSYLYPADPSKRRYRLPWQAGKKFEMMDGYFSDPMGHPVWSDHPDYSFDFRMPEGEPILAARAGRVAKIHNQTLPGQKGDANYVVIEREDTLDNGKPVVSRDWYEHVRYDMPVKKGDRVDQGQIIAYNSNSGCFHMHLHFEVNLKGHEGRSVTALGGDGRKITSIPTPFAEVDRKGGYPVLGEYWASQNTGGPDD
jgi:murein DD-endopeptidase MepM/ murein hydrolase activator NlpD